MKVFHLNINGIIKIISNVKLLLQETKHKIDILGVTKTHLHKNIMGEEITIEGYTFVRKDRKFGLGGGVGCFIRNDYHWQRREDLEKEGIEGIWIQTFVKNTRPMLICIIYRPPDTSKYLDKNFASIFHDMININASESKELILMGDLYIDYVDNLNLKGIKGIIAGNGLKQIINKPTRVTKDTCTFIDIIATSHDQNVRNQITCPISLSDHDLVDVILKKNWQKSPPRRITTRTYAKYDKNKFKEDLKSQPWGEVEEERDVEKAWEIFKGLSEK